MMRALAGAFEDPGPVRVLATESMAGPMFEGARARTGPGAGNRAEGVIFAVRTFAIKLTQGLGGLIGGFGLEILDFPDDAATQGVSPEVIDGLLFMMGPLYYIIVYAGLGFAFLYRIDKRRHEEILQALEARRAP